MFLEAIKADFESLLTRPIHYPDETAGGVKLRIEILPHDTPAYRDALATLGVDPVPFALRGATYEDRMMSLMIVGQIGNGNVPGDDTDHKAEEDRRQIIEARFNHKQYEECYTVAEAIKAAPAVAEHLVKAVVEVHPNGDEKPVPPAKVKAWFLSPNVLPRILQLDPEEGQKDGSERQKALYMGGHPQGAAVTLAVLAEAIQEHMFRERIVPLSTASDSPAGPKATTARKRASAPA